MIDIHTHILPNLDDGASNLEESIDMVEKLISLGFKGAIATPHLSPGIYNNERDQIFEKIDELKGLLKSQNIKFEIYPGAEIALGVEIEKIRSGEFLTIADKKKHVLIELPFIEYPDFADKALFELQSSGLIPVLAHAERNSVIQEKISLAEELVRRGILLQVNLSSLGGAFGKESQESARKLLISNLVFVLATDIHPRGEGFFKTIRHGMEKAEKLVGKSKVRELLSKNPRSLLE